MFNDFLGTKSLKNDLKLKYIKNSCARIDNRLQVSLNVLEF